MATVRKMFPTRDALVRGSLQAVRMVNLVAMRRAISVETDDPIGGLLVEFGSWFEQPSGLRGGRLTLDLWAESCRSVATRRDFVEIHDFWIELLTLLIESQIGEGRLPFTPGNVAAVLLAAFDGLQLSVTLCDDNQIGVRGVIQAALGFWEAVRKHCDAAASELGAPNYA